MPSTVVKPLDVRGLCRTERLPIASGQTFKQGDFLAVNSSGQVIQAVAAGTGTTTSGEFIFWSSGITGLIAGRAMEDAQPSANDPTILPSTKLYAEFTVAEPGTQFLVPIYHATASSAYPNPNLIGTQGELYNLSGSTITSLATGVAWPSNAYVFRLDKTTNAVCMIVDFDPSTYPSWPDVGQASPPSSGVLSQYAYAWVEFLGGQCLLSGARPVTRSN